MNPVRAAEEVAASGDSQEEGALPGLGLVSVPLLGSASDCCVGAMVAGGPFIWALSLGVLLSPPPPPEGRRAGRAAVPGHRAPGLALLVLGMGLLDA
ncbi:Solute carrier family 45 member 3 [Myotis davidii]|uniref:Solute carrier family 45 member 3 n=1 Tax=Myotis davidii TaxID=225400 RepID=L5M0P1_MYODS|nr:Solute carrier family 45 member 3 [Myotis davidii]